MAPRRGRKEPRMNGALDAMRVMGFDPKAVRKCVTKLLKVYGKEGWYFIEECSYKVLIDALLEEGGDTEPPLAITGGDNGASSSSVPHQVAGDEDDGVPIQDVPQVVEPLHAITGGNTGASSSSVPLPCGIEDADRRLVGDEDDHGVHISNDSQDAPESSKPKMMKMRKPCYGWISDDNDNSDDDDKFVYVSLANEDDYFPLP